jgi:hypothetical protein
MGSMATAETQPGKQRGRLMTIYIPAAGVLLECPNPRGDRTPTGVPERQQLTGASGLSCDPSSMRVRLERLEREFAKLHFRC